MLFKRKDSKYWWYKFTDPSGRVVRGSTQTEDKRKAQELLDRLRSSAWDQDKLGVKPKKTWEEAVVRWLSESSKRSLPTDKSHLRFLIPHLSGKTLDSINKDVIESIIKAKLATGCSKTRVNRMTGVIGAILNKAKKEWSWIDETPHIRKFTEPKKRLRWLTQEEAEKLLAMLPDHTRAMAQFSLATGLRESNVTRLEWSQIDLQRKVAWIHADQSKTGKPIGVPLNDTAIDVLVRQIGKHRLRVFTYQGVPVDKAATKAWRKALAKAGITEFRWHDLRHTWASWHVQAGTPLNVLQELGGWSSFEMVQKYAHLAPEHLAQYANNASMKTEKKRIYRVK